MTEQTAAQVDPLDTFVQEDPDQVSEQAEVESQATESAPVEEATPESTDAEKPKDDGVQTRFNKITAEKYAEKRRADKLQKELEEARAQNTAPPLTEPTLEGHDYDTDAFNEANVQYQIQQGVKNELELQSQQAANQKQAEAQQKLQDDFEKRVNDFGKADFSEKANAIPTLPPGVANAMMQSEQGAEMIYHLGENLEKADSLANMTPEAAMMELGRLSVQLSTKPEIKLSAAPDPIEPLNSGGSLEKSDDDMTMSEFMAKYG